MDDGASRREEEIFQQRCPWMRIVMCVRLALDARRMILGAVGVAVFMIGWSVIGLISPDAMRLDLQQANSPWVIRESLDSGTRVLQGYPWQGAARVVAEPVVVIALPFLAMFEIGGGTARFAFAAIATLWAIMVWGIFGVAIVRCVVLDQAIGQRIGAWKALGFGIGKIVPLLWAPVGAFLGVACFAALCSLVGLIYRIPEPAGPTIAGALMIIPLLASVVMLMILIGLALGWPLMVATIAVEAEDAFDAFSRAYSYVYQRLLAFLGLTLVSWVVGSLGFLLVLGGASIVVHLAAWGLAFGAPDDLVATYFETGSSRNGDPMGIHRGWFTVLAFLIHGWVYAYFWSAVAQIYLLLRRDVDGAPFDDIASSDRIPKVVEPGISIQDSTEPLAGGS